MYFWLEWGKIFGRIYATDFESVSYETDFASECRSRKQFWAAQHMANLTLIIAGHFPLDSKYMMQKSEG